MSLHSAFLVYAKEYFKNPNLYVVNKEKYELKNEFTTLSSSFDPV